jgi:SPP1 gp7 family putative phage head morphogenesis protein
MSFQKEMIKIKEESEKYGIKNTKQILQLFKRNQDEVLSKIGKIYLKYMSDNGLNISDYQRYTVLTEIEKQLRKGLEALSENQTKITYDTLKEVYEETYYKSAFLIEKGVTATTNFALLKPEFVRAAIERPIKGVHFSESIWKNTDNLAKRVISDVEKALIQGVSPEKLARSIKTDFGSTAYEAKRLVNTEVSKSVMYAQDQVYQDSGVVKEVLWDATLEDNTCDICASLDGNTYDKNNHPDLPVHPNCRCTIIGLVDGWKPTSKRENVRSADGTKKIVDYTDVNSWKKTRLGVD